MFVKRFTMWIKFQSILGYPVPAPADPATFFKREVTPEYSHPYHSISTYWNIDKHKKRARKRTKTAVRCHGMIS